MMKKIMMMMGVLFFGISTQAQTSTSIQWMTFEEAVEAQENGDDRPVFIDVYTDWCGWCKRMDNTTFRNEEVVEYMNETYLNVKLDGEYRDTITFRGHDFVFVNSGRRGYHELAATLLQGRLSYPTYVFLDGEMNMIQPIPGYKEAGDFINIAEYIGDEYYLNISWEDFLEDRAEDEEPETDQEED